MTYRSMRYFTRPTLLAADRERRAAGIKNRHAQPTLTRLPKAHRIAIVAAYPFLNGFGDGIPQMRCVVQWAEGGLQWTMDVPLERYRLLPKMTVEDSELYRMA